MHTTKRRRRRRRRRASPARCLLGCLCIAILLSIYTALWATSDIETDDAQPRLRGVNRDRIAFLFLVRDQIPTAPIWKAFFDDADEQGARGLYKIYTHPRPGFTYAPSSLFYGTEVTNRTRVKWGAVTVARAEMRLIVSALRDPRTQRSILMSEAGVPLHPFWCLHTYLFSTERSFVASWRTDERRKVLYDFGVEDDLYKKRWRKGHQWVALTRKHMSVLDAAQYEKFRKAHAMSSRAADFRREWRGPAKEADDTHHCFADEHFAATTLAVHGVEGEVVPVCCGVSHHAIDATCSPNAGLADLHLLRRLPSRRTTAPRSFRYYAAHEARLARDDVQARGHHARTTKCGAGPVPLFE